MQRLSFFTQVIELFTSAVSYHERLDNFVHLLARNVKCDLALFFALDKNRESLFLSASSQRPLPPAPRLEFPLGEGIVGQTAESRQPLMAFRDDPGVAEGNRALEDILPMFKTLAAFAVMDDNFLYGVLLLMDKTHLELKPHDQESILMACRMLASNIRQAMLHDEAKKRIAELSVLFDVGRAISSTIEINDLLDRIVGVCAKVINARGAAIQITDAETREVTLAAHYGEIPLTCPPGGTPAVSTPREGGHPALEAEILTEDGRIHYYLGSPLIFKGHLTGMLCVYDKMTENHGHSGFDAENSQLLQTMAGLITSSIENALSFQKVEALAEKNQRLVRILMVLQEISWALMTTIRLERILDIMLNALTLEDALGYDRARIFLIEEDQQTLKEIKESCQRSLSLPIPLREALLHSVNNLSLAHNEVQAALEIPLQDNHGVLARSVQKKKSIHVKQEVADPQVQAQEFLSLPLLVKDKVIGIVVVDNHITKRPITEEDIHFISMFANQAAYALENSRLYATIEANNRELTLMRERMLESDRLAALSSLAEGMAHEIRNPLVSIGGFARRISKHVDESSPLRQYVDVIVDEVDRLEKILKEVLDYSGENLGYFQEHDLSRLIDEALMLIHRDLVASNITVHKEISVLPRVLCDERQIKQVLYNLFLNARQSMEKGGTLSIRTFPVEKPDGLYAAISISDTGGGIPLELLHNIFNPFFTTKPHGTGLGLAIAQRIVARHYGEIEVNNELGKGVTFIVNLPISKYCLIRS